MDDVWLGLGVVVVLVLTVVGAVVYDLRGRTTKDVSDEAVRRARALDARHQSPGPPAGTTFP